MLILIPAYKPDSSLLELISNLNSQAQQEGQKLSILLVNDGSGPAYDPLFAQAKEIGQALADLHILTLPENRGKGAALRAGISWAQKQAPGQVIISADADGQHLPADILALGRETEKAAEEGQKSLLLGVRTLEDPQAPQQKVPLRSRVGNALTAFLFGLSTGQKVADTQTGLRGFTPQILPWLLKVPGDRYEYEFNMLLRASRFGISLTQVPISRVYEAGNPTSHFKPIQDSLRIYAPLLGFLASSFSGFIIDTLALLVLVALGSPLLPAVIAARIISASCNFALNRFLMHDGGPRPQARQSLGRYALLAIVLLLANAGLLEALTWLGLPLLLAKVLVELVLIPISFAVQRRWVFAKGQPLNKEQEATHKELLVGA